MTAAWIPTTAAGDAFDAPADQLCGKCGVEPGTNPMGTGYWCVWCLAALVEEVEERSNDPAPRELSDFNAQDGTPAAVLPEAVDSGPLPATEPDGSTAPIAQAAVYGLDGLGDEFWSALPVLEHVRTAARARRVAPTAVLGSVLVRVAAFTPPAYCIPAFVGGVVPLSLVVALTGSTSQGKSANDRVAADLLPATPPGTAGPFALGSGEGATDAFIERCTEKDDNGRKVHRQRQLHYGVLFTLDEGRVLSEIGSRSGSTIVPTLCTMWTGGDPGRMNASVENRRTLPQSGYSFGLISLWQPTLMDGLFNEVDGGLPGRFVFLGVTDPDVPDVAPDWPGPIDWQPLPPITIDGRVEHRPLTFSHDVAAEVDAERRDRLRGDPTHPLDGHRMLNRLKVAGTLAILDGSTDSVAEVHWQLAGRILDASDRTRASILAELDHLRRSREHAGNAKAGRREVAKVTAVEERALTAAANAVGRRAHRDPGRRLLKADFTRAIKGSDRKIVGTDPAIEEAERLGYIIAADGGWIAGATRPA